MYTQTPVLYTENLSIGYHTSKRKAKFVAGPLNLRLYPGSLVSLLGPNGCGKSTLLRTISGLQRSVAGDVYITELNDNNDLTAQHSLNSLSQSELARRISVVLTDNVRSGNLDVHSVVALGRFPYSGRFGILKEVDYVAINDAVRATGIQSLLNRKLDTLSDGECQKVMLARAMAQDTPVIILDEPTAHLDLPSRIQLMELLHHLSKVLNKAILISTHELDLALQVSDQVWVMSGDGNVDSGLPEDLVLSGAFQRAFTKEGINFDMETGTFKIRQQGIGEIAVEGAGAAAFWTKKALVRSGYIIVNDSSSLLVRLITSPQGAKWILKQGPVETDYFSLHALLEALFRHSSNL